MFDKLLIFIMFLGPLVFFHELGHFLFARFFGVRVETFSIGFGPKLLSFKRGDTQYALSLIPLGGYVKMFGDNVLERDSVEESERQYAYTHKSIWARFWIVFGGPLANFIMAFVLFWGLFLVGEDAPSAKMGNIETNSDIYKVGFRTADTIISINNGSVENVNDLSLLKKGESNTFTVLRGRTSVEIVSEMDTEKFIEQFAKTMGTPLRQPLVVNRKGDFFVLSLSSTKVNWELPLETITQMDEKVWLIPISKTAQKNEVTNEYNNEDIEFNKGVEVSKSESMVDFFQDNKVYPADLSVKSLVMSSAADKAGVKALDIVTHVAGEPIYSFHEMRNLIQKHGSEGDIEFTLLREGSVKKMNLFVEKDKTDNSYKVGIYRRVDFIAPAMVKSKSKGVFESLPLALERTWAGMGEVLSVFKKLIWGEASMQNLGGPIAIGKYAAASFYSGLTRFFAFMAMMSINLGIINLFPIPVLDGGHILFLGVEFVNRGPLSKKKMNIAYQVGFSLLIMMLAVALFNDFSNLFNG